MGATAKPRKVEIESEYGLEVRFQIIRPRGGAPHQKHLVFDDRAQFEQFFMARDGVVPELLTNWRVAPEFAWVLADDGGVCQILKRGSLKHPKDSKRKQFAPNGYCRTVVGTFNTNGHYEMDTDFTAHANRYTFTNNPQSFQGNYAVRNRDYLTNKEKLFVTNLMMYLQQGNGRMEAMVMAVKEAGYAANDIYSTLKKANLLLQQDRIMKLISEQMTDAAEELGITVKAVMKDVWEMGHGDKNGQGKARREDVRLAALKQSGVYAGMERTEILESGQLESGFSGFERNKLEDGNGKSDVEELEAEFAEFETIDKDGDKRK